MRGWKSEIVNIAKRQAYRYVYITRNTVPLDMVHMTSKRASSTERWMQFRWLASDRQTKETERNLNGKTIIRRKAAE